MILLTQKSRYSVQIQKNFYITLLLFSGTFYAQGVGLSSWMKGDGILIHGTHDEVRSPFVIHISNTYICLYNCINISVSKLLKGFEMIFI